MWPRESADVGGATLKSRFATFATRFFAPATSFDDVRKRCESGEGLLGQMNKKLFLASFDELSRSILDEEEFLKQAAEEK